MKVSIKSMVQTAVLSGLFGVVPLAANALEFDPLGEGVLPSGKYVQNFKFTIYPGESVPWHYHPGQIYGVLLSGTLTEDHGCGQAPGVLTAGSAFSESPGAIHRVFNYGIDPVVIVFTFIVPPAYAGYTGTIYVKGPHCDR